MNISRITLACVAGLLPAALHAQPQIGGGTCTSSALTGTYSLMLTGRNLSSAVAFSSVIQGVGLATFDGLSKVSFTLSNNTNQNFGVAQTWSGTYSLQSNCLGVINITTGDTATFTLGAFAQTNQLAASFFIDGQDGVYSLLGSGSTQPSSACTASLLSGTYQFTGNGFTLNSGAIAGVNQVSGLLTFDGVGAVTSNWYVTAGASNANDLASGTFTVNANCTATATITDSAKNAYVLVFTLTDAKETTFLVTGSNQQLIFSGNGRIL